MVARSSIVLAGGRVGIHSHRCREAAGKAPHCGTVKPNGNDMLHTATSHRRERHGHGRDFKPSATIVYATLNGLIADFAPGSRVLLFVWRTDTHTHARVLLVDPC